MGDDGREAVRVTTSGLVARRDAASYLGRQPATLRTWAAQHRGPTVIHIQGRAFYRLADLKHLVEHGDVASTLEAVA